MAPDLQRPVRDVTVADLIEILSLHGYGAQLTQIHHRLVAIERAVAKEGPIVTAIQDLAAKDAALAGELDTFIADVKAKLDQLGSLSPEDQAVVDQLGGDLDAFTAKLQGADSNQPPAPATAT